MIEIPPEILDRRDAFCRRRSVEVSDAGFAWGLDAFVWITNVDTVVKVHRYSDRYRREFAAYQRFQQLRVGRLRGFHIPDLLQYDDHLEILELSFVRPPYILDFVEAHLDRRPETFDLERIETESRRQFGQDWPDVRRLLEAMMQIGIYYDDVHNQNIRLR